MKKKIVKLTEGDLEKLVKKIIKEDEEEYRSNDPDQLDLFTGETKEVNEKVEEFKYLKKLILDEIEGLDINYLYTAMSMGQMDRELEDYYNLVQELENWVNTNDFEGELMREANNLLDILEYGPIDYEITLTPEIKELLKKERQNMSEGQRKKSLLKEAPVRRDIGSHEDMKTYGKNTKWAPASERGDSEYFYNMAIEKFGPVTVFISDDDKIKIACMENGYCYDQTDRMVSREEAAQMLGVESLDVIGD